VHVVPYPLPAGDSPRRLRVGEDRFVVVVIFNVASNFSRKNPCAAIEAFRRAFGDDRSARLVVKYTNGAAWPEGIRRMQAVAGGACNIELIGDVLDEAGMDGLYARADVVMSLHRAEGLGLVLAEAMLRGIPTVATDWSGNADFLTPETGVPVACRLVPIDDPQANYTGAGGRWAEPDIDAAAAALRALRADPALRARLGQAAAAHIATAFDPSRYVSRLAGILGVEGGGDMDEAGPAADGRR
jgi:glycosyltransferase involved in cell wall biosynthesis